MLRQYFEVKQQHPGCIVFFRLGDFYEMFGDDAKLASQILQITLTSRAAGGDVPLPMCGVPHHSADRYIAELVRQGHKVAICEQVEDPKLAKGVVKREVVRVVTPGTVLDGELLSSKENNYLVAVARAARERGHGALIAEEEVSYALAACDLSTGEFTGTELAGPGAKSALRDELARLRPVEALLDPSFATRQGEEEREYAFGGLTCRIEVLDEGSFSYRQAYQRLLDHFRAQSLEGFGCEDRPLLIRAAGAAVAYLSETQKSSLAQITRLATYQVGGVMALDASTRRNLELSRTLRSGERRGSLLWVLDRTKTAMGGRLLRQWVEQPLIDAAAIRTRLDAVEAFVEDPELLRTVQRALERVLDVERLTGRIAFGSANGRDLVALAASLEPLPELKKALRAGLRSERLVHLADELDPCEDISGAIRAAIVDDPPASVTEGGIIRPGYSREVDELKAAQREGKDWIARLEQSERERTGIRSLKVGFNKVFGYYIEVTRPNLSLVPGDYERKQTLANAERFVTPELKEKESLILGAEERVAQLEYEIFSGLRARIAGETARLQEVARILAEIDVYAGLAACAVERRYCRPEVDEGDRIEIRDGRHPVVEAVLEPGSFVPNDLELDRETQVIILTGPNMAGKSTYLRQAALIVLMAQVGSFVPARSARIGVVDRIFTRVGASDDLATGQSTFMVEMNEVANILNHATSKSLVILDEVGRGTSTFDGLSIAWAVTERLLTYEPGRAKTLFATHYHELTELEELYPAVKNYSVAVHKEGGDIVFLRRIVRGGVDQSYGIEVARLAGLPAEVIARAREILAALEAGEERRLAREAAAAALESKRAARPMRERPRQLSLFPETDPIIERLCRLDPDNMTPLQALNVLAELVRQAKRGVVSG